MNFMTATDIQKRIQELAPGTLVEVIDLTGTQDHWRAEIVSPAFAGKSMIEQHRLVYDLFKDEMSSGAVHALTIKTFAPDQKRK